jgi:hypothetical protein
MPSALFPQPPVIHFAPERADCLCGSRLFVQKTRRKTVLSLSGPFIAHETLLQCPACARSFGSEALLALVAPRCNVAYDVMTFVGRGLFSRHRSTEEVRIELLARDVRLCLSEINYLGRKFISLLAMAHQQATPRIRREMARVGGYILHLDAMHEGDAPALMSGLDGLNKTVLANVKVPTEKSTHIVPFLRDVRETFGIPRACVHDMGTGLCKAVAQVFPDIPDFICHFHFLRDIGKDLLDPAYRDLRNRLRSHAATSRLGALVRESRQRLIQHPESISELAKAILSVNPPSNKGLLTLVSSYSLALWALQGKHIGDGYGLPFDRPLLHFAERILDLEQRLPQILKRHPSEKRKEKRPLLKLAQIASEIAQDPDLGRAVKELRRRSETFDCLRKAMRIASPGGGRGLNDDGTTESMANIRQGVEAFRRKLDDDPALAEDPLSRNMAEQIDKYGEKLFAEPIEVDTPNGKITLYPQRTNNILEQFFRDFRRAHRRKTGNNSMSRVLHTMLADTPLVKNLDNPDYMNLLLDGKASLEELFAELGKSPCSFQNKQASDRILPGFRSIIKLQKLPQQVLRIFAKSQELAANMA